MRNLQLPGRSPVYSTSGTVATSHPQASVAALNVLQRGGNAVDAAVTAAAVQTVVEPHMTAIGGDGFALIAKADGSVFGYNGSGRAPKAVSSGQLLADGLTEIDPKSAHAVTVPGVIRSWETLLNEHGTIGLDEALQPAISHAENGFCVLPRIAFDWAKAAGELVKKGGGANYYLKDGKAYEAGDALRLPQLAQTLRKIAEGGADAFYTGEVAEDIIQTLKAHGSLMEMEDLAAMKVDAIKPLSSSYRHVDLLELPPNGVGIIGQVILNTMENFDISSMDVSGAERMHLEMEAARQGYHLRDRHIADIDHVQVSLDDLISKEYSAKLAAGINLEKRNDVLSLPDPKLRSDTIYLTVVDKDGTCVSLINSIFESFGSCIVTEKTGVVLQNRGACFTLQKGHPNTIEGGKRPLHTIIPAMIMEGGKPRYSFGVMGGAYQPAGHAHVVSNLIDYGMDPQEALDHARIFWDADGILQVEDGFGSDMVSALQAKGHPAQMAPSPIGGGQIIEIDHKRGVLIAGSDHRKDGCALGL